MNIDYQKQRLNISFVNLNKCPNNLDVNKIMPLNQNQFANAYAFALKPPRPPKIVTGPLSEMKTDKLFTYSTCSLLKFLRIIKGSRSDISLFLRTLSKREEKRKVNKERSTKVQQLEG